MIKRGLSNIVTMVLLVLIAIAGVSIIWYYISSSVDEVNEVEDIGSDEFLFGTIEVLEVLVKEKEIIETGETYKDLSFYVRRISGTRTIESLRIILEDSDGNSFPLEPLTGEEVNIKSLERRIFDIRISDEIGEIVKFTLIPIFEEGEGGRVVKNIVPVSVDLIGQKFLVSSLKRGGGGGGGGSVLENREEVLLSVPNAPSDFVFNGD